MKERYFIVFYIPTKQGKALLPACASIVTEVEFPNAESLDLTVCTENDYEGVVFTNILEITKEDFLAWTRKGKPQIGKLLSDSGATTDANTTPGEDESARYPTPDSTENIV